MDDTDTATIELTRDEAREVINALSEHRLAASGRDEERALNVREFLEREFEFEERHFENEGGPVEGDEGPIATFLNLFEGGSKHEIHLSRAEAAEVVSALADLETTSDPEEAGTIATLRDRFEETFDLGGAHAT